MRKFSFKHHLVGITTAVILFNLFAIASSFFQGNRADRMIGAIKFEDSLSGPSSVTVVDVNVFEASRVGATKAMDKGARIGFIYPTDGLCNEVENAGQKLNAALVTTIDDMATPAYLDNSVALLKAQSSLGSACLNKRSVAKFIYTGSGEFRDNLMKRGFKPRFLAISNASD